MAKTEKKNRIDKWLWSVRIYKTRTLAGDMCKAGKVKINGKAVKASSEVKENDEIHLRKDSIIRVYRVKGIIQKRVSAVLAKEYVEELTPEEELNKLLIKKVESAFYANKSYSGKGRPTKKERRNIDKWFED